MKIWKGDSFFLNQSCEFWLNEFNHPEQVTWTFNKLTHQMIPFSIYTCSLNFMGDLAIGSAFSKCDNLAAKMAFAEAWERIWMKNHSILLKSPHPSSNGYAAGESSIQAN